MFIENANWTKRCQEAEQHRQQGNTVCRERNSRLLTGILVCVLLPVYLLVGFVQGVAGYSLLSWLSNHRCRH